MAPASCSHGFSLLFTPRDREALAATAGGARACARDRATAYESRGGVHSCSPDFRGGVRSMAAETYPCATVRAFVARVFLFFIITVVDAAVVVAIW